MKKTICLYISESIMTQFDQRIQPLARSVGIELLIDKFLTTNQTLLDLKKIKDDKK